MPQSPKNLIAILQKSFKEVFFIIIMRNGFYFVAAGFGSLLIGFVSGWYANSKLDYYR